MIQRYLSRISGPLLDRIDIQIEVVPVPFRNLTETGVSLNSCSMRETVMAARKLQGTRFERLTGVLTNSQMEAGLLQKHCSLDQAGSAILRLAMERLGLSARAYNRILRVARTIADLEGCGQISASHIAESVNYRNLDRMGWNG
jgi:magnesium chelatase family protein